MALQVHVVKRKVPAGEDAGMEKFYGQVRMRQTIPLSKLSQRVSANTSATGADVEMVINGLVNALADNLDNGNILQVGDFGNFRLSTGSAGAGTKEEFKCWMMRKPRVIFTPGKMLTNMLAGVTFDWLPVITEEGEVDCDQPHA